MSLSPMLVFSRLPIPFRLSHTMETISLHRDGLSALCGPSADIENRPGIREDPQDQGAETEKVGPNAHVEPKHGDERTDGADGECRAGQEARVRRSNVAQRQEQEEPRGQGKQKAGSRMKARRSPVPKRMPAHTPAAKADHSTPRTTNRPALPASARSS